MKFKLPKKKLILDPCCSDRKFWFDKQNPHVVFGDIRNETYTTSDRTIEICPDMQLDFRNLPFKDREFKMVVFDPPHLNDAGKTGWLAKSYGVLDKDTWRDDLRSGFNECMRCLDIYGTLIFKWNETQIKVSEILDIIEYEPLFGHKSGRHSKTIWMAFLKLP